MTQDTSARSDAPPRSRPRALLLLDSAGQAAALKALTDARGITLHVQTQSAPSADDQRAIALQSVPPTADAHWFAHVAPGHVPVRFHLPHMAELVITPAQDEGACTAVADALVQLGLQVLLAPARTGLLVDRIRHACLNEALALLGEGVPAEQIEKAGIDAGLVTGPLAMLDAQGLDITDTLYHQTLGGHGCGCGHNHHHDHGHGHGHHQAHDHDRAHRHSHSHGHQHDHAQGHEHHHGHGQVHAHGHDHDDHHHGTSCADQGQDDTDHHGHEHAHHDHAHERHEHSHASTWPAMTDEAVYVMEKMAHGFQRKGSTTGGGFYSRDDDDDLALWSGLSTFVRRSQKLPADDVRDRLRYITATEVLQALAARAAANAASAEIAAIGTGLWADAAQGPLAFIRATGADAFATRAGQLAGQYGQRFALPDGWQKHLP